MALEPKYTHSFPSEQRYKDDSKSSKTAFTVFDASKTAADYGVENIGKTQEVSSTENGGGEGGEGTP